MEKEDISYCGFAILELMGHRRLGGYVKQVEQFGCAMLRIDIPAVGEGYKPSTQFYGGASIYCITPTTEEMAKAVAATNQPTPVHQWELPAPKQTQPVNTLDIIDDDFEEREEQWS